MRDGVDVFALSSDDKGNEVKEPLGKSAIAGRMAVMQSAASRVLTNMCANHEVVRLTPDPS